MKVAIKRAFPLTIPVLIGYLFLGIGFGVLLVKAGYNVFYSFFSALTVFSGSLQYAEVDLLKSKFDVVSVIVMTIAVNIRHLFYGLTILDKYKNLGVYKFFCIFGLTDETYSLVVSRQVPTEVTKGKFYFAITILNHLYWIAGCTIGALFGQLIPFNSKGIEFVMTALFVVIFYEQWENAKEHESAIVGIISTVIPLILLKLFLPAFSSYFLIVAMIIIFITLTVRKESLTRRLDEYGK